MFVLFTDGITEAMNAAEELFGEDRLGALIEEHADLPFEELRERILREVRAFAGEPGPHDDMTLILLKVEPSACAAAAAVALPRSPSHDRARVLARLRRAVIATGARRSPHLSRHSDGTDGCCPRRTCARLVLHGHIYTGDPAAPWVEALAVCDERIVARRNERRDRGDGGALHTTARRWRAGRSSPASTTATCT